MMCSITEKHFMICSITENIYPCQDSNPDLQQVEVLPIKLQGCVVIKITVFV